MSTVRKLRLRSRSRSSSMSPRKVVVKKRKSRKRGAASASPERSGDLIGSGQKKMCSKPIWDSSTIYDSDVKFEVRRSVAVNKRKDMRLKLEYPEEKVIKRQMLDIPVLGLSTFKINGAETMRRAIDAALTYGYRLFDMTSHTNEHNIGKALQHLLPLHGLNRSDVYLITKLQPRVSSYSEVIDSVDQSLTHLHTDYLDVVLLQWPNAFDQRGLSTVLDCYAALEDLYKLDKIRDLGAYKFNKGQLTGLLNNCTVVPAMLQAEFHPYLYQDDLVDLCREHSIRMQAFCFIKVLNDPTIVKLARLYLKAPSQIILRWIIQHGVGVLPKSKTPDHICENAQIFDFCLTPEDMDRINSLNRGLSFTPL